MLPSLAYLEGWIALRLNSALRKFACNRLCFPIRGIDLEYLGMDLFANWQFN
jgi:hypothetical protein